MSFDLSKFKEYKGRRATKGIGKMVSVNGDTGFYFGAEIVCEVRGEKRGYIPATLFTDDRGQVALLLGEGNIRTWIGHGGGIYVHARDLVKKMNLQPKQKAPVTVEKHDGKSYLVFNFNQPTPTAPTGESE